MAPAVRIEVIHRQSWTTIFSQPSITFGAAGCDLAIEHDGPARQGCALKVMAGHLVAQPSPDDRHLFKNEKRLLFSEPLEPGDVLLFGNTRLCATLIDEPPAPSAASEHEARSSETKPHWLAELASKSTPLRRLVAANPGAPPQLLATLSSCPDTLTQRAVAANPNTPRSTLLRLAQRHPVDVLANPVLPLLVLEDPAMSSLLANMGEVGFLRVAARDEAPDSRRLRNG